MATKKSTSAASAAKATKASKTPVKTAPASSDTAQKPTVVTESQSVSVGSELKKRELLELVSERSDIKKKFSKPVVEAMLEVLGEALAEGRALNLQPLGRVVPQRTKDAGKNRVIITRIRQSKEKMEQITSVDAENQPVAKVAE